MFGVWCEALMLQIVFESLRRSRLHILRVIHFNTLTSHLNTHFWMRQMQGKNSRHIFGQHLYLFLIREIQFCPARVEQTSAQIPRRIASAISSSILKAQLSFEFWALSSALRFECSALLWVLNAQLWALGAWLSFELWALSSALSFECSAQHWVFSNQLSFELRVPSSALNFEHSAQLQASSAQLSFKLRVLSF